MKYLEFQKLSNNSKAVSLNPTFKLERDGRLVDIKISKNQNTQSRRYYSRMTFHFVHIVNQRNQRGSFCNFLGVKIVSSMFFKNGLYKHHLFYF